MLLETTGMTPIRKCRACGKEAYTNVRTNLYRLRPTKKRRHSMTHTKSQELLYKKVGGDESYTPRYGVIPILKYIPRDAIVWCPFDTMNSEYVKEISKTHKVVFSHIDSGEDFFSYEPEQWDVIISNPPFKDKRKFFERALSFNKPFALLMTCTWLNDKYSKWVFKEANREMELLMFDKRIHFEQEGTTRRATTFSSAYFCSNLLPKQIIIEELTV